jgi:hypothetical protein
MTLTVLSSHSLGTKTWALLPDRPTAVSMQFEQCKKAIQAPKSNRLCWEAHFTIMWCVGEYILYIVLGIS